MCVCVCVCARDQTHMCVVSTFLFRCRPWDCTSFLNLSSKCATSPVSCCWDSVVGGGGRGVKRLVRRGETGGRGGGDNRGVGRSRVVSEGRVCGVYVCGTQQLTSFSPLSSSFSYLFCHHPISVPRLLGLFGGGLAL